MSYLSTAVMAITIVFVILSACSSVKINVRTRNMKIIKHANYT